MEFAAEGPKAIPLWLNGHAYLTVTNDFFDVCDPNSGEALRRVPLCGSEEAATVVAAASAAQQPWAASGMMARRVCLDRLAEALEHYAAHFAKLLIAETGFAPAQAEAEVAAALSALRETAIGETGVMAVVTDATQPLAGFVEVAVPALLAGATIVVKPSPKAPSALFALCELSARCEWPAGVLNLLQGDSAAVEGLCAAPIDVLAYVGSEAVGVQVGALAARYEKSFVSRVR